VFRLSDLFGQSSALNFVVAHYQVLTIKALQVVGLRSPINARHFGFYAKRAAALRAVFRWAPDHLCSWHFCLTSFFLLQQDANLETVPANTQHEVKKCNLVTTVTFCAAITMLALPPNSDIGGVKQMSVMGH
jgi:hypothetical protein